MRLTPDWTYVADCVMGGVSKGQATRCQIKGRDAMRLTGRVSLDNNGGFIQMAFDVTATGGAFDASAYTGLSLDVLGNGARYDLRLRTMQLLRPWQSFRTAFDTPPDWCDIRVPFTKFKPHKTDAQFDPASLRRIGILAIGSEFDADIAVAAVRLYI